METVLIVIHLMLVVALVITVLLQRSEGGALGIGGGGGGGGFMSGRGTANVLTRATAVLALGFFATSMLLTILARHEAPSRSIFDDPTFTVPQAGEPAPETAPDGSILDQIRGDQPGGPQVPASE